MAKISIIIVTCNAIKIIKDCFISIFRQDFKDFEVIVVDNNSLDRTKEFIKDNFPQVKLIENKKNLGFCRANNQGIAISQGEYILTLNSDVILEKNFLRELINQAENSSSIVGMFSPKILKMDKKTIDSTGIILTRIRRFYNRGEGEIDFGQYDDKRDIFGPSAACALYKKEMFEKIKIGDNEYFDNDFFFLVEDVDLAWRANLMGFKGLFIPNALCYHLGNSFGLSRKMRQYLSFRNRFLTMLKNESWGYFLKNLVFLLLYDIPRFLYLIFTNLLVFKATFEIIYLLHKILNKRRRITLFTRLGIISLYEIF
ncbi:MAG: glycosyltransferase family 2 protein [Candidatus Omnitrophica bacterium]|nr:glycosyltransferase family 2 protein [Candidatus Omnitrophota bacterium]